MLRVLKFNLKANQMSKIYCYTFQWAWKWARICKWKCQAFYPESSTLSITSNFYVWCNNFKSNINITNGNHCYLFLIISIEIKIDKPTVTLLLSSPPTDNNYDKCDATPCRGKHQVSGKSVNELNWWCSFIISFMLFN